MSGVGTLIIGRPRLLSGERRATTDYTLVCEEPDQCPADYRSYAAWRRHPVALAWVSVRHLQAELAAMRGAWRDVRPELGPVLSAGSLSDALGSLTQEGLRLRAALRGAELILEALRVRAPIARR